METVTDAFLPVAERVDLCKTITYTKREMIFRLGAVPIVAFVLPIWVHFLNPCATYAPQMFAWTTAIYMIAVLPLFLSSFIFNYVGYCSRQQANNHVIIHAILCLSMGSIISLFDSYTYSFDSRAAFGVMFQFAVVLILYTVCILEKHMRSCPAFAKNKNGACRAENENLKIGRMKLGLDGSVVLFYLLWLSLPIIYLHFEHELDGTARDTLDCLG